MLYSVSILEARQSIGISEHKERGLGPLLIPRFSLFDSDA
jgi:hypothetical protein